jgi:hypothetical protein
MHVADEQKGAPHTALDTSEAASAGKAGPKTATHTAPLDLSVIIVNYNTRDVTAQAVQSVLDNPGNLDVEIIVVDNESSDGSVKALRAAFPQVTVLAAGHNGGYAWGNNIGITQARGRYVLILNPDAQVYDGTLEQAVRYMDANRDVGILGAHVALESGTQQLTVFRHVSLGNLIWNMLVPNRIIRKSHLFGDQRYASIALDKAQDVDIVAGCFMMLPRTVIDTVGMMDDRFFMYSEESEWCWRVKQTGLKVRYNPEIRIMHYGAVSTGQTSPWKSVEIAKGHILFLRFTRGPIVAWFGALIMLLGDLLRAVWFLPAMLINPRHEGAHTWRARTGFLLRALFNPPRGQTPPRASPSLE